MKLPPFILMFALFGCARSDSDNPASHTSRQIEEWVPPGTSLALARQIMEQHQFACTVVSYDSKAAMPPGADTLRWDTGIIRDGKPESVTNLTLLICRRNETNGGVWVYETTLTVLNGETDSRLKTSASRIK